MSSDIAWNEKGSIWLIYNLDIFLQNQHQNHIKLKLTGNVLSRIVKSKTNDQTYVLYLLKLKIPPGDRKE